MRKLFHLSPLTPILLIILAASLAGCRHSTGGDGYVTRQGEVWNTLYTVTYRGPESLGDSIGVVLDSVGASLSVFDPTSLVSRVNASKECTVDRHFREVYLTSRRVNRWSHGMFDPTLSPLITAWGFGKGHGPTSDTLRLDSLLAITGIRRSRLEGDVLVKEDPRIQFNFSAIAKGYGCDRVGAMLRRNGVEDYMVEIGGEIAATGKSPRGTGWRIAIDSPTQTPGGKPQEVVELTDGALATSGDYRNWHESSGRRFGHTISPLTGQPAQSDLASVTVMAPTCMEADALATASMAMGASASMAMLDSLKVGYFLIMPDGRVVDRLGRR